MKFISYSHRFADIIINSDYVLRKEIETVIDSISLEDLRDKYRSDNELLKARGKKEKVGMQAPLNKMFKNLFTSYGWESEKNVFGDKDNDLVIDFWKRNIGVDVAFNHRSFVGGDLLGFKQPEKLKTLSISEYIFVLRRI